MDEAERLRAANRARHAALPWWRRFPWWLVAALPLAALLWWVQLTPLLALLCAWRG
jgi:hypothetical protein